MVAIVIFLIPFWSLLFGVSKICISSFYSPSIVSWTFAMLLNSICNNDFYMIYPPCGHIMILSHPWTLRWFQHLRVINSPHPLPFSSQTPLEWVRTSPCLMSGRLCRSLGSSHACSGAARHARASQKVRGTQKVKPSASLHNLPSPATAPTPSGHKRRYCELGRPKAVPGSFLMLVKAAQTSQGTKGTWMTPE